MAATAKEFSGIVLSLIGAVAGGAIGYYTFRWIYHHGFYGMMIPGAMVGLGCGLLAPSPSHARGLLCAVAALALGLFTEWNFFWSEKSIGDFLKNVGSLGSVTLLMIAGGSIFAYWLGKDAGFRLLPGRSVREQRDT